MKSDRFSRFIENIYMDNYSHIDFMDNMNGGDCDCNLHQALVIIDKYSIGIEG